MLSLHQLRCFLATYEHGSLTAAAALPAAVRDWEPPVALFSADEGMAAIRALLAGADDYF